MRNTILFLALGMFLGASVTANACDHDKACVKTSKASTISVKPGKAKASLTMTGKSCTDNKNRVVKNCATGTGCPVKNCPIPSNCGSGVKASKTAKTSSVTAEKN